MEYGDGIGRNVEDVRQAHALGDDVRNLQKQKEYI